MIAGTLYGLLFVNMAPCLIAEVSTVDIRQVDHHCRQVDFTIGDLTSRRLGVSARCP